MTKYDQMLRTLKSIRDNCDEEDGDGQALNEAITLLTKHSRLIEYYETYETAQRNSDE